MSERILRIAVLVSGGGTNLQAIIDAIQSGEIRGTQIAAVISNSRKAYALKRAEKAGIPAICLEPLRYPSRQQFNEALKNTLDELGVDLIVLAGCLLTIPPELIRAYENRIINIHPSLIPSFCGKGFYGLRVHEAALARGVKVSGATVHFVNRGLDEGPIILQKAVEVKDGDTPETLQKRIMEQAEWKLLPQVIDLIAAGRVKLENGRVRIEAEEGEL